VHSKIVIYHRTFLYMREEIIEHIAQLESEQGISILLAVESGSRAWGCPSPDSDFDVRIIYKRAKDAYLKIDEPNASIDYFHGELLDINGWDIKKTLKLIRKSNATPFEWAQSPIKYKEVNNFSKKILDLSGEYFQAKHTINHYRGIAKNTYLKKDSDNKMKLKSLFYILRPLMAAKWISLKNEIPPMDIPSLLPIVKNESFIGHINKLLDKKATVGEDYVHLVDSKVINYIEDEFKYLNELVFEDEKNGINSDSLNKAFREIIE